MTILGLVGAGTSIWAVLLLRETLEATREANKNAALGAEAAIAVVNLERPWMACDGVDILHFRNSTIDDVSVDRTLGFRSRWKNFGSAPAQDTTLVINLAVVPFESGPPRFTFDMDSVAHQSSIVAPTMVVTSNQALLTGEQYADFMERKVAAYVFSATRYRKPGFESYFTTENCQRAECRGTQNDSDGDSTELLVVYPQGPQNKAT